MAEDLVQKVPALHLQDAIRQGADAKVEFEMLDANSLAKNLDGYSLFAQIRDQDYEDTEQGLPIADWVVDKSDAANGIFVLTLHRDVTAAIAVGRYIWDALLQAPDGEIRHFVPNTVVVVPGVTAPPVETP